MKVEGRTAVITGAATGMGRELALSLVQSGCNVALCDIKMENLEKTIKDALRLRSHQGVRVSKHEVDVTDREGMKRFAQEVTEQHDGVHLLFANAGISGMGDLLYEDNTTESEAKARDAAFDRCFNVNYYGVLYSVREFLPIISKQDEGYVIITSSVNGFWTWPNHGSYTAAKFAVNGLAQALLCEMAVKAPHVHVACVHPGKVKTEILRNTLEQARSEDIVPVSKTAVEDFDAKWKDGTGLSSAEAAQWILSGVAKNSSRILVGYDANALDFAKRVFGNRLYDLYATMGKMGIGSFALDDNSYQELQLAVSKMSLLDKMRLAFAAKYHILFIGFPTAFMEFHNVRRSLMLATAFLLRNRHPKIATTLLVGTLYGLIKSRL